MYFKELNKLGINNKLTAEEAREFVDCGVHANHLTASAAAATYKLQICNRQISGLSGVSAAVLEYGTLAQAKTLVQNHHLFK